MAPMNEKQPDMNREEKPSKKMDLKAERDRLSALSLREDGQRQDGVRESTTDAEKTTESRLKNDRFGDGNILDKQRISSIENSGAVAIHESGDSNRCFVCSGIGHWARECPSLPSAYLINEPPICYCCGGSGHFARVCPSSPSSFSLKNLRRLNTMLQQEAQQVAEDDDDYHDDEKLGEKGEAPVGGDEGVSGSRIPSAEYRQRVWRHYMRGLRSRPPPDNRYGPWYEDEARFGMPSMSLLYDPSHPYEFPYMNTGLAFDPFYYEPNYYGSYGMPNSFPFSLDYYSTTIPEEHDDEQEKKGSSESATSQSASP
jgi:Zinc knuckle